MVRNVQSGEDKGAREPAIEEESKIHCKPKHKLTRLDNLTVYKDRLAKIDACQDLLPDHVRALNAKKTPFHSVKDLFEMRDGGPRGPLFSQPSPEGLQSLRVFLEIQVDGTVKDVQAVKKGIPADHQAAVKCVLDQVSKWRFPDRSESAARAKPQGLTLPINLNEKRSKKLSHPKAKGTP